MKKIITLSLLVLILSFSGNAMAHCGDAEAHAAASQEHMEKDSTVKDDDKKENKAYKNKLNKTLLR